MYERYEVGLAKARRCGWALIHVAYYYFYYCRVLLAILMTRRRDIASDADAMGLPR